MRGLGSGGMTRRWALGGLRLQGRGHSGGHCPPLSCFEASDTSSQGCQLLLAFVCPQSRTRASSYPCVCVFACILRQACAPSRRGRVTTSEVQCCHDLGRGEAPGPQAGGGLEAGTPCSAQGGPTPSAPALRCQRCPGEKPSSAEAGPFMP